MSAKFAEKTIKAVTAWARYANLFTYDEQSETFALDSTA